jgi:hypothetical protein
MEYISWQHVTGGMGRVVHILATKLGVLYLALPRQNTTQKGRGSGGGLSWMAPVRPVGPHAHAPEDSHRRAAWLWHMFGFRMRGSRADAVMLHVSTYGDSLSGCTDGTFCRICNRISIAPGRDTSGVRPLFAPVRYHCLARLPVCCSPAVRPRSLFLCAVGRKTRFCGLGSSATAQLDCLSPGRDRRKFVAQDIVHIPFGWI